LPTRHAKMFLSITDPTSSSGRIFDCSGKLTEIKNVNCPVLTVFDSKDEYQSNPGKK